MSIFITVAVMTYNRVETLRDTLDSLLPQIATLPDIEVLVSDNASTDNTGDVVREYCARYPRLRYSRNPENVGFDGNVVACIENARGEYLMYCSDDDVAPAGLLSKLAAELAETRPVAAYINHTPFFHDDPKAVTAPTQPVLRRVFTNPTEFFLYCGLGFISALTLKTSEARKFTSKAAMGRGTAHVDISSRVVLASGGPFLFDGTLTILARHAYSSGYDPLQYGAINTTLVHLELLKEGLLTQRDVDWHNRKTIRLFLTRCILNNRINGRKIVTAGELRKLYGKDPHFYLQAYPLALIPPLLMRIIGLPARWIMRKMRDSQLKRGAQGKPPTHMAP